MVGNPVVDLAKSSGLLSRATFYVLSQKFSYCGQDIRDEIRSRDDDHNFWLGDILQGDILQGDVLQGDVLQGDVFQGDVFQDKDNRFRQGTDQRKIFLETEGV